jgi:hypothetical protein
MCWGFSFSEAQKGEKAFQEAVGIFFGASCARHAKRADIFRDLAHPIEFNRDLPFELVRRSCRR